MTTYLEHYYAQKAETDRRIADDTERYRKSDFTVKLTDRTGKPVAARAKITQKKHDFKFGCNIFMLDQFPDEAHNRIYREKFPELFNYAVVPFYWSDYEVEEGKPRVGLDAPNVYRRPAPELVLQYAAENGIDSKGHCLMWQQFMPEWLSEDKEQNMRFLERRITQIAGEYGARIRDFDVVNETLARKPQREYEKKIPYDCTNRTFAYTDGVMPDNRLFINETTGNTWINFAKENSAYYLQIENLLMKGRRIDAIGLQYHIFEKPENWEAKKDRFTNPAHLFEVLDYYAHFERPVHVSEITVPAYADMAGSPELQAEVTELLYRLWFSHPCVEAIVWWNLVDGTAAYAPLGSEEGENYYHGGLLNYDMSEKPVYRALDRLINHEWKTEIDTTIDGAYSFRGFHGEYALTLELPDGTTVERSFSLLRDGAREIEVVI